MAETYSAGQQGQSTVMKKIFDQIEREKNENEYNRTEIQDRTAGFGDTLLRFQYDLNQSGDVRILDNFDSFTKLNGYFNKNLDHNKTHFKRTVNGLSDPSDLVHLQIKGKNQLFKEIEETQMIDNKYIDELALHRNEITKEVEGEEILAQMQAAQNAKKTWGNAAKSASLRQTLITKSPNAEHGDDPHISNATDENQADQIKRLKIDEVIMEHFEKPKFYM